MEIKLDRAFKKEKYTIGHIYLDGEYFCDTMEDTDRELFQGQGETYIKEHKIYGETAIPRGRYLIDMDKVSPKYSQQKRYMDICEGKLPRLVNVPGWTGVLIHIGNYAKDSLGCILVGRNTRKAMVTNSTETFKALYAKLKEAHDNGEEIWITIE